MFKRQHNESPYSKSVSVTERVLLVWCLKDNTMNHLTVKVWQSLRRFAQNGRLRECFFAKKYHSKLH